MKLGRRSGGKGEGHVRQKVEDRQVELRGAALLHTSNDDADAELAVRQLAAARAAEEKGLLELEAVRGLL